jgi:hypothetical protein
MLNKDFKDMLQCLLEEKVDFLLVGGYALGAHGYPRTTKDIDLWIWADDANSNRVYRALTKFGAPIDQFSPKDFSQPGVVFQIGVPPNRIDLVTAIDGVDFKTCYKSHITVNLEDLTIPVISKQDLIANKRATGRAQDQLDAKVLENGQA